MVRARLLVESGPHHVARRPGREREVEGESRRGSTADLVGTARPGVERVLVRRDVEHGRVVPEDVLGAVPVVHVPVDDEHSLAECGARRRGNGHVVEEAEAHGPIARRVMARGADRHEGDGVALLFERLQRGQPRSRSTPRRLPRVRSRGGVGIDGAASLLAERGEPGQIRRIMDARQLLEGRLAEGGRHNLLFGSQGAHALHDSDQT